jgi:hypothetical protein|tara:strand:- start:4803 stop:5249 length:447 start_codon:yes stop_codon:yes gene_type:complete
MFGNIKQHLASLNNSKFFAGLVMIMLNIGSKYITIELSKTQEEYLKNHVARQILIFSISWMGTRDILMSLGLTAIFIVLTDFLFNENSKFCVIPMEYRKYKDVLDLNGDGVVTPDEIKKAEEILSKAKQQQNNTTMLKTMNQFKMDIV